MAPSAALPFAYAPAVPIFQTFPIIIFEKKPSDLLTQVRSRLIRVLIKAEHAHIVVKDWKNEPS